MPKRIKPEELKVRVNISLSRDDVEGFENFLEDMRRICLVNGADEKEVSSFLSRSGFLQWAVSFLGKPEVREAMKHLVLGHLGLSEVQTEMNL
jgi:hypothetical protein